jgi:RNA polymerase sigma-70 factor (ECF subfamily)
MTSRDYAPVSGVFDPRPAASVDDPPRAEPSAARLRCVVERHYDFVWRTLRFHGVPDATAEDAAQQVFCVFARRLDEIALGAELSFLFATATHVASDARRTLRRRPVTIETDIDTLEAPLPSPEDLVDERRAREVLHEIVETMQENLRVVFVLYEIEELTLPVIASMLGLREGTATSRLRRARLEFKSILKRRKAAESHSLRGART